MTYISSAELDRLIEQEQEVERLRSVLRDVIFDLHNCEYGGDMPRCEHIADALKTARRVILTSPKV